MSCEKDDPTVIDPTLNFPSISNQSLIPSVFDTIMVRSVAKVTVTSIDPIGRVIATVSDPKSVQTVFELKDDGVAPDVTANDGVYSGYIHYEMSSCWLVGTYKTEFLASTQAGLNSSVIIQNFTVNNSHSRNPVISNLIVSPHDAQINIIAPFLFKVNVTDPDGQCDIFHVTYRGYFPDGQPLQNNYDLLDDGSCCLIPPFNSASGDSLAGDGIYTRLLAGAPNQNGYYKYFFFAVDRSLDTSNFLIDSIFVHP